MIKSSKPVRYEELNLAIVKALFTLKGDTLTNPLSKLGGLKSIIYKRRHVVVSGGFDFTGKNSQMGKKTNVITFDQHLEKFKMPKNLLVYPNSISDLDKIIPIIDEFEIAATENNSSYYCVVPNTDGYLIKHEIIYFKKNETINLLKGNLYFANVNLNIQNENVEAASPLAIITNSTTAISTSDGAIGRFFAEKAG